MNMRDMCHEYIGGAFWKILCWQYFGGLFAFPLSEAHMGSRHRTAAAVL